MTKPDKLATLLAKLKEGKRLTKAEERFVEQSKAEARFVPTLDAVAQHFGVTKAALYKWQRPGDEETYAGGPKGYDVEAFTAVRKRFLGTSKNPRMLQSDFSGDGEENDVTALKARKIRLECDKLATQIDILRGKYALVEDVLAELMPIIYAIKDRFLKLGPEVAYQLSGMEPADIEDKIRGGVEKILNKLADEDIPALAAALSAPKDIGDQPDRMPAARETNGRQQA
jgi:hypothetical protein